MEEIRTIENGGDVDMLTTSNTVFSFRPLTTNIMLSWSEKCNRAGKGTRKQELCSEAEGIGVDWSGEEKVEGITCLFLQLPRRRL